jgi:hypothetical protein
VNTSIRLDAQQFLQLYMITLRLVPRFSSSANSSSHTATLTLATDLDLRRHTLLEQLSVLQEQKGQLEHTLDTARKKRKFEDVAGLEEAVSQVRTEMDRIEDELRGLLSS